MATICPYCNIEVSEHLIEAEDGCCPECGALIGAQNDYMEDDIAEYEDDGETSEGFELDDEFMDDFEDGEEDDEFYDEFDEEFDFDDEEFDFDDDDENFDDFE
ncbi:MAG: hypothetical protein RR060_07315 [Victivallaceae bacterium]